MKNYIFISVLSLFILSACGSVVKSDVYADNTSFGEFETYAYLPSGDTSSSRLIFEEKVIKEVNEEMQERGYRLDINDPDLLVYVSSLYHEGNMLANQPIPSAYDYYGPGFMPPAARNPYYYPGYTEIPNIQAETVREAQYTAGTFVVDIINTDTRKIIWRGWTTTAVDLEDMDVSVRNYIDEIFEEYPVND